VSLAMAKQSPHTGSGLFLLHCRGVAPPDELLLGPAGTIQDKGSRLKPEAAFETVTH
jgi:hypothetical protein